MATATNMEAYFFFFACIRIRAWIKQNEEDRKKKRTQHGEPTTRWSKYKRRWFRYFSLVFEAQRAHANGYMLRTHFTRVKFLFTVVCECVFRSVHSCSAWMLCRCMNRHCVRLCTDDRVFSLVYSITLNAKNVTNDHTAGTVAKSNLFNQKHQFRSFSFAFSFVRFI